MFCMARLDSLQRQEVLRSEIQEQTAAIQTDMLTLQKYAAGTAVQVGDFTNTVASFAKQLDTNADFTVDAVQQVHDEGNGRIGALTKFIPASNARGAGASSDVPLATSTGEPIKDDAAGILSDAV